MNRNERIKYLLEKKGVSYDAVGEKLKIGKAAVSNRLNRAKEIDDEDFIKAIVEATGYPEEMILNGDGFQEVFFSENYVNEPPSKKFKRRSLRMKTPG
jgi:transcriptional regulator with XRE-family HTH domain